MKLRKNLIEWIFNIGFRLKQRDITQQLAVVYLDRLLIKGHGDEIEKQKFLFGVTLLMIASKYDEIDDNIPFIRDFKNASS